MRLRIPVLGFCVIHQNDIGTVRVDLAHPTVNLAKVASDLRLLSMGPRGGLAEITLPQLQDGSSIMPDKVNPVITEMAAEVAHQVISFDQAITSAALSGQLELNASCLSLPSTFSQALNFSPMRSRFSGPTASRGSKQTRKDA